MIFWFKKIVGQLLTPLSIMMLLLGVGIFLLWWKDGKHKKIGRWLVTGSFGWLAVIALLPIGGCLVAPLEYKYPALTDPASHPEASKAKYVVVLGGGHSHGKNIPPTSELNLVTLARAVEAVRLHQALPHTEVIFSGGSVYYASKNKPNAEVLQAAAEAIGLPKGASRTSLKSRDTKDEAQAIADLIGKEPFILVTSASHMPRSVALFRNRGLDPIPAPTGHRTKHGEFRPGVGTFFPNSGRIAACERAIHEYLGIVWGKLRGQI